MDFLIENNEHIVDLVYFDTTSTYFEVEPGFGEEEELRRAGHSKDHRPDLLQIVIGLAVTRDGIPVRCWIWPGNTVDMEVIADVKRDLIGWKLGRVITVVGDAEARARYVLARNPLDAKNFPRIDQAKVKKEARLDGKYLLRTSDDALSPEDVALG